ncbi:hypothetical protein LTS18_006572 [Coniosporium uncinatum]|uniref:Uncharacterized protein n=1 Tax=Coniosporium uncinatum TaxID=93489 RepID=A0ACC3DZP2_9PEZI|nr:hypothetical protein LTS18_006572 [Coniosporium uncinatum]
MAAENAVDNQRLENLLRTIAESGYSDLEYSEEERTEIERFILGAPSADSDAAFDLYYRMTVNHDLIRAIIEKTLLQATLVMATVYRHNYALDSRVVSFFNSDFKRKSLIVQLWTRNSIAAFYPATFSHTVRRRPGPSKTWEVVRDSIPSGSRNGITVDMKEGRIVLLDGSTGFEVKEGWFIMLGYIMVDKIPPEWGYLRIEKADPKNVRRLRTNNLGARFKVVHDGEEESLNDPLKYNR